MNAYQPADIHRRGVADYRLKVLKENFEGLFVEILAEHHAERDSADHSAGDSG
jgi:hypothetical protein